MAPEQRISPLLVTGLYVLCGGSVASASVHSAAAGTITANGDGGLQQLSWRHKPSFIPKRKNKSPRKWPDLLLQTRGGDAEDAGGADTAVLDAGITAEGDVVASDDTSVDGARKLTFSVTKPYDGSPEDPDGIPTRFLLMKKGDRVGAREAFEETCQWREENDVDTILTRPHRLYDVCKAMVPHYFAGNDPHDNIIFIQRPALLDFELMRKNNATIEDLLTHYIYIIEYCWNILETGPTEGVMTNVLDMRGLRFRTMKNQEYIDFGKRFVNMMSSNYPGRSYRTLVINAPKWFHALYKIFKPLLRESTREKIVILKAGEHQNAALKQYLGDSMPMDLMSDKVEAPVEHVPGTRYFLPVETREECTPGPNSHVEFDMREFVIEQLSFHNETMKEVL